jgi:hypothetical protein
MSDRTLTGYFFELLPGGPYRTQMRKLPGTTKIAQDFDDSAAKLGVDVNGAVSLMESYYSILRAIVDLGPTPDEYGVRALNHRLEDTYIELDKMLHPLLQEMVRLGYKDGELRMPRDLKVPGMKG